MPFNGAGAYSPPATDFPAVPTTLIESTHFNNVINDIATALSTCITKDGQTTVTGNIPFAGFRLTGVGAGVARTDAANVGQLQDNTATWCGTAAGTADAITLTPSPAIAAFVAGMSFIYKSGVAANTGAMTVAISGLATKAIQSNGAAMVAGSHAISKWYRITYDGAAFQLEQLQPSLAQSLGTTKGDVIVFSAAGVAIRLGVGTDGFALLADSTQAGGVVWASTATGLAALCNARLTLETGVAVSTTDQTAKGTVYATPYKSNKMATYDGTKWNVATFTEKSVAVPATTSTPFDVFIVDGTLALETVNWTNDTTRATALALQDGVWVKSGTATRRYLGTCRTTTVNGQCEDSKANRFVWNCNNRVLRNTLTTFTADRSTTNASYVELNTEIRSGFVLGQTEDAVFGAITGTAFNASGGNDFSVGIAFDSTTAVEPGLEAAVQAGATNDGSVGISGLKFGLAVGFHYATLLGKSPNGVNTVTYRGTTGSGFAKDYLHLGIWG